MFVPRCACALRCGLPGKLNSWHVGAHPSVANPLLYKDKLKSNRGPKLSKADRRRSNIGDWIGNLKVWGVARVLLCRSVVSEGAKWLLLHTNKTRNHFATANPRKQSPSTHPRTHAGAHERTNGPAQALLAHM